MTVTDWLNENPEQAIRDSAVRLFCPTCQTVTRQERWLDRHGPRDTVDTFCLSCTTWRPMADPLVERVRVVRAEARQ